MCKRQFVSFNNFGFSQIPIFYVLFFLTTGNQMLAVNVLKVNGFCSVHIHTAN